MFNVRSLMAKRKTGFTLVEILVVILIIGLLFVFLVPKIDSSTDKARETGIKTDMRSYQTAFESVAREQGGLGKNAVKNEENAIKLVNGYLDPALKITYAADSDEMATAKDDPWNNKYLVDYIAGGDTSNNAIITLRTKGKDVTDAYNASKLDATYTANAKGEITGDIDGDLENARIGTGKGDEVDDYILGTWYIDGQIFTATAGFTTNIESGAVVSAGAGAGAGE